MSWSSQSGSSQNGSSGSGSLRRHRTTILAAILFSTSVLAAESVAVQVETQKGKPIEGAVVSVRDSESGTVLDSAVSSDEGVAIIQQLTPGEWYFEIDRSGYMLYTAYVQVRAGKKPELGFASQVSRGDDWDPMRVKFTKASDKLMRKALIEAPAAPRVRQPVRVEPQPEPPTEAAPEAAPESTPEPAARVETRPEQMPAPEDVVRVEPPESETSTIAVPSTVEDVDAETVSAAEEAPPELSVADGEPQPLEDQPLEDQPLEDQPLEDQPLEPQTQEDRPPAAEPASEPQVEAAEAAQQPPTDRAAPEQPPLPQAQPDTAEDAGTAADPPAEPLAAPAQDITESAEPADPVATAGQPIEPAIEPGVDGSAESAIQAPGAEAPSIEPSAPGPSGPPQGSRSLRSAAAGTCPECAAGEWAVSAEVSAATAGDTRSTSSCAGDLDDRVQAFAESLADRRQERFAGALTAALWRTAEDAVRAEMAEAAAGFNNPQAYCQVAGVVLPAGATMTGYVYEAWDELGGRACNAQGICALPKAAWAEAPTVVSGDHATVVYGIFRNRSTRHNRSAELTVLFTPPPEWQ